jgi:hypothetical protein
MMFYLILLQGERLEVRTVRFTKLNVSYIKGYLVLDLIIAIDKIQLYRNKIVDSESCPFSYTIQYTIWVQSACHLFRLNLYEMQIKKTCGGAGKEILCEKIF